ncbi:MAG: hypothetical protein SGI88_14280, partial [Candidatus Hydrogenedentes bacterium]|nr:hypothetical protein [Candidatus Hydrogenedentota bacterium]
MNKLSSQKCSLRRYVAAMGWMLLILAQIGFCGPVFAQDEPAAAAPAPAAEPAPAPAAEPAPAPAAEPAPAAA